MTRALCGYSACRNSEVFLLATVIKAVTGGDAIKGPSVRVNERIRTKEVRVIDEEGRQLGVTSSAGPLNCSRSDDLVEVAPQAQPPVCRIVDFGKYLYEQKKRAHEAKKKQVVIEVKEIKFRPATDEHDYNFKMKHAGRFLPTGIK